MRWAAAAMTVCVLASQAQPPFRSGVDAVRVDVLVTDRNRPVAGLTAADFVLLDNGVPQELHDVSIEDVPFSMMLALDVSDSVTDGLEHLRSAAQAAVDALQPADRAALLTFSELVDVAVPWTARTADLANALASIKTGGGTSLYDGTYAALTLRDLQPGRRALLLIFSDGADTTSWLPDSVVAAAARRTDVVVYAVALRDEPVVPSRVMFRSGIELMPGLRSARTPHEFLNEIAEITGGTIYQAERRAMLRERFAAIVREFRSRYILIYTPRSVASDGWHRIDVRLKDRRGQVRARRGYSR